MNKGTSYALLLGLTLIAAVCLAGCEKLIPAMLPHMLRPWKSEDGSRSLEDGGKNSPSAVENITSEERRVAATLKDAHDPIEEEKRLFKAEIRGAFDDGNFSHLESVIKEIRMSMPRLPTASMLRLSVWAHPVSSGDVVCLEVDDQNGEVRYSGIFSR